LVAFTQALKPLSVNFKHLWAGDLKITGDILEAWQRAKL
jgi:hypothetical protein